MLKFYYKIDYYYNSASDDKDNFFFADKECYCRSYFFPNRNQVVRRIICISKSLPVIPKVGN